MLGRRPAPALTVSPGAATAVTHREEPALLGSLRRGGLSVAIASALTVILAVSAVAETPPQPPSGS